MDNESPPANLRCVNFNEQFLDGDRILRTFVFEDGSAWSSIDDKHWCCAWQPKTAAPPPAEEVPILDAWRVLATVELAFDELATVSINRGYKATQRKAEMIVRAIRAYNGGRVGGPVYRTDSPFI